ncbi:hypothetical protein DTO027B5_8855 [Paecilomyces variotii]|nr:hypothetical protein DTO027B3_8879 [Paecilomyces variotii]KAJ9327985.1 hypothetical protein DTO027B5_8855 [Paecilomyces variotii]
MSSSYWFRKGPNPGTIITLDQPVHSRWKILEQLNEHDYQVNEEENHESRQATTYNPPELIAYRDLTEKGSSHTPKLLGYKTDKQDRSGLVPGGFIIWLVWEIVPGLRLGDGNGADPFWALEVYEREQVRLAFLEALPNLHENGWFPTQTLYFIGPFEKAGNPERPIIFGANWIADFDLAKPDPSTGERDSDWDKDTSRWQW